MNDSWLTGYQSILDFFLTFNINHNLWTLKMSFMVYWLRTKSNDRAHKLIMKEFSEVTQSRRAGGPLPIDFYTIKSSSFFLFFSFFFFNKGNHPLVVIRKTADLRQSSDSEATVSFISLNLVLLTFKWQTQHNHRRGVINHYKFVINNPLRCSWLRKH